jgi:methionyl-tRNA synthetase
VIYVGDVLERYGADPLRYYLSIAGPETSDTDFTWHQFVTRNNTELVAGWGNLVNRALALVAKNLGAIPAAGDQTDDDRALLERSAKALDAVGELFERARLKAAVTEAMRVVADANKYLSDMAPWKLRESDPDRFATIMHTALQAISDCNTLLTPVIPNAADEVSAALRGSDVSSSVWSGQPEMVEVDDLDGGPSYPVLTGDYSSVAAWRSHPIEAGTPIAPPRPLFQKLDDSVVDAELARLEAGV